MLPIKLFVLVKATLGWINEEKAYVVFWVSKLFFYTNPHFDTDRHNKCANLPILGRQHRNAACLCPRSHAVFLHIVLCSYKANGWGWGGWGVAQAFLGNKCALMENG